MSFGSNSLSLCLRHAAATAFVVRPPTCGVAPVARMVILPTGIFAAGLILFGVDIWKPFPVGNANSPGGLESWR